MWYSYRHVIIECGTHLVDLYIVKGAWSVAFDLLIFGKKNVSNYQEHSKNLKFRYKFYQFRKS